jgi:hypothetical protein
MPYPISLADQPELTPTIDIAGATKLKKILILQPSN